MDLTDAELERRIRPLRRIKLSNFSPMIEKKARKVHNIFNLALDNREIPALPYIYEGYQAKIKQAPDLNRILIDCHYVDIARFIAATFYSKRSELVSHLSYLLLAENLICAGNVELSYHYSKLFRSECFNSIPLYREVMQIEDIYYSEDVQLLLAIEHELSHFLYDADDYENILIKPPVRTVIEDYNRQSEYINAIDLSKIHQYLDKIDKSAMTSGKTYQIFMFSMALRDVFEKHGDLVVFPDGKRNDEMLVVACEKYLRGEKCATLDVEELVTECTCDIRAIAKHLSLEIAGKEQKEVHKLVIEGYILVLLTQDILELVEEVCSLGINREIREVDSVIMRRTFVRQVLPMVLEGCGYEIKDIDDVINYYDNACYDYDFIYGMFCEQVYGKDYSYLRENITPCSEQSDEYMMEIIKNIMCPLFSA